MEVTKPYEFIGFGAMEVTKPYEFIGAETQANGPDRCQAKLGSHWPILPAWANRLKNFPARGHRRPASGTRIVFAFVFCFVFYICPRQTGSPGG